MNTGAFGESVQGYLRSTGYSQKNLADTLGLHPKVLSRKLRANGEAHLTQLEAERIIKTLAQWRAISTRDEALHLLELAHLRQSSFTLEEWNAPPLSQLEVEHIEPALSLASASRSPTPYHNLPSPTTRLIGRDWALERLRQQLERDEVRVVSLIGPGGCGKTRLALQLAHEMLPAFPGGTWFVSLSGLNDADMVPTSIMRALGLPLLSDADPVESIINYLREKRLLLVLDNFDRVLEAVSFVGKLLAAVAGLKVLVTSRVAPHLYGEREFSVPPLDIPNINFPLEVAECGNFSSIQLFLERVQALVPEFALTEENGSIIAQICARLDGLPLALELAAGLVKLLSPEMLLERVSSMRLNVLTRGAANLPTRQQTMRNTMEWSYQLLSPLEQRWFPRLAIFAGGWSIEAGEAMIRDMARQEGRDGADFEATSPLEIFGQLLDKSLLVRQSPGEGRVRFTMLETIREYALELLAARGEFESLRDWHATYYLKLAEAAESGLRGSQQPVWLARMVTEQDNLRAALKWVLWQIGAEATTGARITSWTHTLRQTLATIHHRVERASL